MKKFVNKIKFLKVFVAGLVFVLLTSAVFLCSNNVKNGVETNSGYALEYVNNDEIDRMIDDFNNESPSLATSYDLSRYYPILAENQTSSNFCWAYASSKVLETSLMVQASEYQNFSETGIALLEYFNDTSEVKNFNREGNFESFCLTMQNFGLIHENDFSNDNYFDIARRTQPNDIEKYRYVLDYAEKLSSQEVLPVCFSYNENYSAMSLSVKQLFIKSYIKKYGGIFAGLEAGTYYSDGGYYGIYKEGNVVNKVDQGVYRQKHAVCVIGWGSKGWLAVNSWGVESQIYEKFYIPYDYEYSYGTFAGFLCTNEGLINVSDSSAETNIRPSGQVIKNIFAYGEELNISYVVDESIDFDGLYFNVFKGQTDVTNEFSSQFDKTARTMNLTINSASSKTPSGTYLVKFYCGNDYIGAKEIFVYTGTEFAYIEFVSDNISNGTEDTVMLLGNHSTNENSATFYVSANSGSSYSYSLKVFINDISSSGLKINVSEFYLTSVVDGKISREYVTGNYGVADSTNIESLLGSAAIRMNFADGQNPAGKMIEFKMSISSTSAGVPSRDIYVKIIVSNHISGGTTVSSDAVAIEYVLNGGINNPYNIDRFPKYNIEENMTTFILYPATKGEDYNFLGWYTDPDFENVFDNDFIDESQTSTLVLYARWSVKNTSYFEGSLGILRVLDHDLNTKQTSDLEYGDSVVLAYEFKEKTDLLSENYLIKYYYYVNDALEFENSISGNGDTNLELELKSPKYATDGQSSLLMGEYEVKILVIVVISRQFSVSEEQTINLNVAPKQTTVNFETLKSQYDGTPKQPLNPVFSGVYDEDLPLIEYGLNAMVETNKIDLDKVINAGKYIFSVTSLNNKNYVLTGETTFDFEITKCELSVNWSNLNLTYNGSSRLPTVTAVLKSDGSAPRDPVTVSVEADNTESEDEETEEFKNVGSYKLKAILSENSNYVIAENETNTMVISPAKIRIVFNDIRDRAQTASIYRKEIEYSVIGAIYGEDDLNLTINCEALTATVSGKYPISATYSNNNYEVTIVEGVYTLTGIYTVFYKLPNGEIYEQFLDDAINPPGITTDIYPLPMLSVFSYNAPLEYNGDDLYITVTIINYSWILWVGLVIVAFVLVYIIVTHKVRKNKIR